MASGPQSTNLRLDCSDGRYKHLHRRTRGGAPLVSDHVIALPGIVLKLGSEQAETVLADIDAMVRLKGITQIRIYDHEDCGAYGLRYGSDGDLGLHLEHLTEAARIIKHRFPGVKVRAHLVRHSRSEGKEWEVQPQPVIRLS